MPRLSVDRAVNSAYLVDIFAVQRRLETVGANGRSALTLVTFNAVAGVVFADGDSSLKTESDSRRTKKTITVITRFALRGSSVDGVPQSYQPDLIIWHGNSFIVDDIEEYSAYGPGFVEATCSMVDMNAQPPVSGAAILVQATLQQYPLTQVSPSQFTANIISSAPLLFRNGLLQAIPADYTITTTLAGGSTINLVIPLGLGDTLVFYA